MLFISFSVCRFFYSFLWISPLAWFVHTFFVFVIHLVCFLLLDEATPAVPVATILDAKLILSIFLVWVDASILIV